MRAIVHAETQDFVRVRNRRAKLKRVEREDFIPRVELLTGPGAQLIKERQQFSH